MSEREIKRMARKNYATVDTRDEYLGEVRSLALAAIPLLSSVWLRKSASVLAAFFILCVHFDDTPGFLFAVCKAL